MVQQWEIRGFHVLHSTYREHLGGGHERVLRARISNRPENTRLAEPRLPELVEEGAAFLRARDSGKPAGLVPLVFG